MVTIGKTDILAPGRWLWARALLWLVVLTVASVVGYNAVARGGLILFAGSADAPADAKLAAACAGSVAVLLLYAAAIQFGERRAPVELALRRAVPELGVGLAIGAAIVSTIVAILWLAGWVTIASQPVTEVALALRDSIRSGVLEELVLRLIAFRLLWRAFGIWPAIVLTAALFGALHLANPDASLFAALCLAAGEGVAIGLYLVTGRIWAAIGMHAAWNFAQGWLFGAAVSGTGEIAGGPFVLRPVEGVSELLSGGGFGPEASLAALVVSLLASGVALGCAWKRGAFVAADVEDRRSA